MLFLDFLRKKYNILYLPCIKIEHARYSKNSRVVELDIFCSCYIKMLTAMRLLEDEKKIFKICNSTAVDVYT